MEPPFRSTLPASALSNDETRPGLRVSIPTPSRLVAQVGRFAGMTDIQVTDNTELARYEAHLDGALAGFAQYELRPGSIVFFHTEVDPAFEGHGIGSTLIKSSMADVR